MTVADLDKLEAADKAATAGPWEARAETSPVAAEGTTYSVKGPRGDWMALQCEDDALLMAEARNALPELLRLARIGLAVEAGAVNCLDERGES